MKKIIPHNQAECEAVGISQMAFPLPRAGERPTIYADRVGEWYVAGRSNHHRKNYGLYMTSVEAADFMAEQIQTTELGVTILDPSAGTGILCCAAVEHLVCRNIEIKGIELVAYELDSHLITPLRAVLSYLRIWCKTLHGLQVKLSIRNDDFVLACGKALTPVSRSAVKKFHIVIANPPYFKIGGLDPRALAASSVVHGQPNIYALFMAVCAALLMPGGEFVFLTPRSFASGTYFRKFREHFFALIRPTKVHIFGSREAAFRRDNVLQENIILVGTRQNAWLHNTPQAVLAVSASHGVNDLDRPTRRAIPIQRALNLTSLDKILRLPITEFDDYVLALLDSWPNTLKSFGLHISTGPVVPFRSRDTIDQTGDTTALHAPLLWMHHVRAMEVSWPLAQSKPEYIKLSNQQVLPNRNYILLRRFSAKTEARRLIAAPYLARKFSVLGVGLENHLNYIHRPSGDVAECEAYGVAALFNSKILDAYFRCLNGNTQVSATELRTMPLPALDVILALGRRIRQARSTTERLDEFVLDLISPMASGTECRKITQRSTQQSA